MSPEAFVHYKTDIVEIDKQHFDILSTASEIVRSRYLSLQELIIETDKLKLLFDHHLKYEEALMRKINYKYLPYHIESHQRLKLNFDKMVDNLKNVNYNKMHIVEKLDKLLLDHVDHDDMQYIEHYKKYQESLTPE